MSAVTAVPLRPLAKGSVLKLWIGLAVLLLLAIGLGWLGTRGLQRTVMANGVAYQVIREGEGDPVTAADVAAVHFTGRRENGEVIADTRRDRPLEATPDNFLPGVGEGLKLMRKGAVYRFWVPPSVWRGQVGQGAPFGPNETLTFDVQVIEIQRDGVQLRRLQALQQQMQGGGPDAMMPGAPGMPGTPGATPPVVPPEPAGNAAAPAGAR
jgi:hypothetical protein